MADYTILLIDYAPRSIEQIRTPLENAGYTVKVANDGDQGRKVFAQVLPDLALIEPMLPKKHGFEVCREIKESPAGESTPILLMVSVYQGRRHRHQAQNQSKCDGFVEKPIREKIFLEAVASAICDRPPRDRSAPAPVSPAEVPEGTPARDPDSPVALPLSDDEIGSATDLIDRLDPALAPGPSAPPAPPEPAPAPEAASKSVAGAATAVKPAPAAESTPASDPQTDIDDFAHEIDDRLNALLGD